MAWKRSMVETDRGNFELFEKGKGPPLAVTHLYSEFNETGDYFAESFVASHRVCIINLKECGGTDRVKHPHELTILETALDLEAIREALGFSVWSFAGHSTGGMLGVVYGIYFSGSLEKLLLSSAAAREYMTFSPACIYHEEHPKFKQMQRLIEALKSEGLSEEKRKELTIERTKLSLHKPEKYQQYFSKPIHKKMSPVRMDFFARELHTFDVTRKLSLIDTPTLIVCGAYDVQCPLSYSEEMALAVPKGKLVVFEESNHYPHLEEAEKFTSMLTEHFD